MAERKKEKGKSTKRGAKSVPRIGHNSEADADGHRSITVALQIEMVRLADLRFNPNNPRVHPKRQRRTLTRNILRHGFRIPIHIDAEYGVIAGQLRCEVAKDLGMTEVPAIRVTDATESEIRAFMIAENRIAELGEWDPKRLAVEFDFLASVNFDLELTGFETPEIDLVFGEAAENNSDDAADEVAVPDLNTPPVTAEGDLWGLGGRHLLLCGNALEPSAYEALMDGAAAQMVFTDPPYNVRINGNVCGTGSIHHPEFVMASGEMTIREHTEFLQTSFTNIANHSLNGAIHYICIDWRHLLHAQLAAQGIFDEFKNLVVWNKSNAGMGSFYRNKHELVLVFKCGNAPHINNFGLGDGGRYRTNVWDYPSVNSFSPDRKDDLQLHPTVKPAAMVADAMLDCSKRGGIVLDPFAGSGTLFIAAEKTGRIGYGMELDPRYVDVAIRRWEKFTGGEARHAVTGATFTETAAQRRTPGLSGPSTGEDE